MDAFPPIVQSFEVNTNRDMLQLNNPRMKRYRLYGDRHATLNDDLKYNDINKKQKKNQINAIKKLDNRQNGLHQLTLSFDKLLHFQRNL